MQEIAEDFRETSSSLRIRFSRCFGLGVVIGFGHNCNFHRSRKVLTTRSPPPQPSPPSPGGEGGTERYVRRQGEGGRHVRRLCQHLVNKQSLTYVRVRFLLDDGQRDWVACRWDGSGADRSRRTTSARDLAVIASSVALRSLGNELITNWALRFLARGRLILTHSDGSLFAVAKGVQSIGADAESDEKILDRFGASIA